jgi:hypothetical protein
MLMFLHMINRDDPGHVPTRSFTNGDMSYQPGALGSLSFPIIFSCPNEWHKFNSIDSSNTYS